MNTYTLAPEERFDLILECRNSGLIDYQWCKQKGISTNTLYRWINKIPTKWISYHSKSKRQISDCTD